MKFPLIESIAYHAYKTFIFKKSPLSITSQRNVKVTPTCKIVSRPTSHKTVLKLQVLYILTFREIQWHSNCDTAAHPIKQGPLRCYTALLVTTLIIIAIRLTMHRNSALHTPTVLGTWLADETLCVNPIRTWKLIFSIFVLIGCFKFKELCCLIIVFIDSLWCLR